MGLNGEGGMSTAKKLDTDYSEYLGFLRFVLSVTERGGSNGLADWINTKPKAGARNASWWGKSGEHCVHAVATRKGSGSDIPLDERDWEKAPYMHAMHALPDPYPAILRGRYSPDPTQLDKFEVVYPILRRYRTADSVRLAKEMLDHIYCPQRVAEGRGGETRKQKIWERFGFTSDEWMDAAERKAWNRLNSRLDELVGPAVMAWVEECRRRGLEI